MLALLFRPDDLAQTSLLGHLELVHQLCHYWPRLDFAKCTVHLGVNNKQRHSKQENCKDL